MALRVGQQVTIHTSSGHTESSPRRVTKVFANGRFEIYGKVGSWYIEESNLARNWNNPGFVPMVAELHDL